MRQVVVKRAPARFLASKSSLLLLLYSLSVASAGLQPEFSRNFPQPPFLMQLALSSADSATFAALQKRKRQLCYASMNEGRRCQSMDQTS